MRIILFCVYYLVLGLVLEFRYHLNLQQIMGIFVLVGVMNFCRRALVN